MPKRKPVKDAMCTCGHARKHHREDCYCRGKKCGCSKFRPGTFERFTDKEIDGGDIEDWLEDKADEVPHSNDLDD